jgi:BatD DUF11 like domain
MQKIYKRFIFISILLFSISASFAQLKFSVQVDESRISTEDYLHLQYTIEHAKKVTKFVPPSFPGFKVIQGPDYTNGWTLINGEMNEYIAISFVLQPIRKGKFVIKPAAANADGQNLRSASVTIDVTDPGSNSNIQTDKQPGNQPLNDMILKEGENINQKIKNNLFLRLELNKTNVFVGEPIVATYKLYTRLNSESKVTRRPSFSGFSVFDMADPESEQAHYETFNGREYNVYLLRKVQLFPLQEGKYELESIQVDNTVSFIKAAFARNQNTLNDILSAFGEEGIGPAAWVKEQVTLTSDPKVITVKALPSLNLPPAFNGAVGQFTIKADLDATELSVGDVANLNLIISGSGNLPVISSPEINWPAGIEIFEPESKEELNKLVSPITGKKIFTIPFSPTTAGRFFIPAVNLVVFDPASGKYIETKTDSIPLLVIAASLGKTKTGKARATDPASAPADSNASIWYLIPMSLLLIFSIAGLIFFSRRNRKKNFKKESPGDSLSAAEVSSEHQARQLSLFPHFYNLDKAQEYIYLNKLSDAYREIEQVIVSVISERYEISRSDTFEKLYAGLVRKYVSEELATETVALLQDCQVAQFSPLIGDEKALLDYERAKIILDRLQGSAFPV